MSIVNTFLVLVHLFFALLLRVLASLCVLTTQINRKPAKPQRCAKASTLPVQAGMSEAQLVQLKSVLEMSEKYNY